MESNKVHPESESKTGNATRDVLSTATPRPVVHTLEIDSKAVNDSPGDFDQKTVDFASDPKSSTKDLRRTGTMNERNNQWERNNQGSLERLRSTIQDVKPDLPDIEGAEIDTTQPVQVKKKFVLDPTSKFMTQWDIWTTILLIFTATVTPYEVGFLATKINFIYFVNRLVDFSFFMDMIMQFYLPYLDGFGNMVSNRREISRRYLTGWFTIDLISILPYDSIGLIVDEVSSVDGTNQETNKETDDLGPIKVLRVVRLLRLMKLLRVLRASRMFARWESRMEINYAMLNLYSFVISLLVICHWLACAWSVTLNLDDLFTPDEDTWVDHYPYLTREDSASRKYLTALYWSIATVTTLSYGDIIPHTDAERLFIIFAMILGGAVYAYIIGGVCGVLAGMNARNANFYQAMDTLNNFLKGKAVGESGAEGRELCARLREFYRFRHLHGNTASDWADILERISPSLRGQVSNALHEGWLKRVRYFQVDNISQDFYVGIALSMQTHLFSPREAIFAPEHTVDRLYVLEKGIVAMKGYIMHKGDCFGSEVFYRPWTSCWGYGANTLSHGMLLWLAAEDLYAILNHPEHANVKKYVRRVVTIVQTKEVVINVARALKLAAAYKRFDRGIEVMRQVLGDGVLNCPEVVDNYNRLRLTEEQHDEMERIVANLQGFVRRSQFVRKCVREYRKRKEEEDLARASTELDDVLVPLGLEDHSIYRDLLIAQRVDSVDLLDKCTAAELTLIGIPLGDAKRIVSRTKNQQ